MTMIDIPIQIDRNSIGLLCLARWYSPYVVNQGARSDLTCFSLLPKSTLEQINHFHKAWMFIAGVSTDLADFALGIHGCAVGVKRALFL